MFTACTAIIVLEDHRVLLGYRSDGQGWSLAGGKQEPDEDLKTCAKRELQEEFGLLASALEPLGRIHAASLVHGKPETVHPMVYLCRDFTGSIKAHDQEMTELQWVDLDLAQEIPNLYPPTREALRVFSDQIQSLL